MCRHIQCEQCKKLNWMGCGQHLEQLFKDTKYEDRCWCKYDFSTMKLSEYIKSYKKSYPHSKSGPFPKH